MMSILKEVTHKRPKIGKLTRSLGDPRDKFEEILGNPVTRKFLAHITNEDENGSCYFEKVLREFGSDDLTHGERLKYLIPHLFIEYFRHRTGAQREAIVKNVSHDPAAVRGLVLTAKSIARYGLTVPQQFYAPLLVVWNVTNACNLTCKHCYQDATHKPLADELSLEEKLDVVDQLGRNWVPFIAFAGGEPLVCKDLWPVLERCRRYGIHTTVATNGLMLSKEMCQRIKEAGVRYVEVSIDSIDPEEHDEFRGMRGAWERSIQGIRNAAETQGLSVGMAACFTRTNVHRANDMINLAKDLGANTFVHFNFIPVGRGKEIANVDLTPQQREKLLKLLTKHMQDGEIAIMSTAPQFGRTCIVNAPGDGWFPTGHAGQGEGEKAKILSRYIGGCGAGRCYCSFQPNGKVNPCVYIPSHDVGDLRKQTLMEIWQNPLFDVLSDRDDRGDHCGVCDYRHYCGGCRARAVSYTDDILAGDPGCIFNLHEWEEVLKESKLIPLPMLDETVPSYFPSYRKDQGEEAAVCVTSYDGMFDNLAKLV